MSTWLLLLIQDPANAAAAPAAGPAGATGPAGAAQPSSPWWLNMLPFALLIVLFYFMLLRPEKKQRQKREAMLRNIQKGQRVVLTSGLHGTIASLTDDMVTLQVDEGVRLKFARAAIQQVLDAAEGDEKTDEKK